MEGQIDRITVGHSLNVSAPLIGRSQPFIGKELSFVQCIHRTFATNWIEPYTNICRNSSHTQ
jgi:hypothetical protein